MKDAMARLLAALALLAGFALVGRTPAVSSAHTPAGVCEAVEAYDESTLVNCLALQPRSVELLVALGSRYEDAERWPEAEDMYRRAVSVDGRDADVQLRLSRLLLRRGDTEGARVARQRLEALRPGHVPSRSADTATSSSALPQ